MKPSKFARFQKQQEKFASSIAERVALIESLYKQMYSSSWKDGNEALLLEAHKLAGTATTLGFVDLGEWGRDVEVVLKHMEDQEQDGAHDRELTRLMSVLDDVIKIPPKTANTLTYGEVTLLHEQEMNHQLIYVLSKHQDDTDDMVSQLQFIDYKVKLFTSTDQLKTALERESPSVILMDMDDEGMLTEIKRVWRKSSGIPLVVISSCENWTCRLQASRAGAYAFFQKPIEYDEILTMLDSLWDQHNSKYRILIVEDDRVLAEHYSVILQGAGMQTDIVDKPEQLLEELGEFTPDLVLMDLYMPGCSGVEAASVIRQHAKHTNLPIVYLSGETDLKLQMKALQVGADDFLTKPISDLHLTQAVSIRARRFRTLSAMMDRDSLTGLLNHTNLKVELEKELSRAHRHHSQVSFVMIDIDHFKSINDSYGHPVGDRVIKGVARLLNYRFRKTDICARYGGEEFALILPDTPPDIALRLIDEFRLTFSRTPFSNGTETFHATLSAGIATFPEFKHIDAIIEAADSALYLAKEQGRNRVVTHVDISKKEPDT